MASKRLLILSFLLVVFLVGSAQNADNKDCIKKDSLHIYSSILSKQSIHTIGLRLFPSPCLSDEEAFNIAQKTGVYLILEKNDTLYMLMEKLGFENLPDLNNANIRDSIFKYFSQRFSRNDSIVNNTFKYHIFSNNTDSVVIADETGDCVKNGVYYSWLYLKIRDSLFQLSKLKYGLSKNDFFRKSLNIDFSYPKKNFVVFMAYFQSNKLSWYYKQFCKHNANGDDLYCKEGNTINSSFFVIDFKNNQIVGIKAYMYP